MIIPSTPLRICLVYPCFPPEESGGGGISTLGRELATALVKAGHHVDVISRSERCSEVVVENVEGIRIHRLPSEDKAFVTISSQFEFRHFGAYLFSQKLRFYIENLSYQGTEFDVIEVPDWGAEAFCLLDRYADQLLVRCSTPAFIAQSFNSNNPPYLSQFVCELEKFCLSKAQHVVSNSQGLIELIKKVTPSRALRISSPPLLNEDSVSWSARTSRHFSAKNPLRLLSAGRVEQRKGVGALLNAAHQINALGLHCEFDWYGASTPCLDGSSSIDRYSRTKPLNFNFHGHVARDELLKRYCLHDVFVFPSIFDSFGYVAAEAIMAGVPPLISNNTGIAELAKTLDCPLFFDPEDESSLVNAIAWTYHYYEQAIEHAHDIRKLLIQRTSAQNVLAEYVELYRSINKRT